jgi:magnesium-transporting ATPase (P-type)
MIRELFEDRKRQKSDKIANKSKANVYRYGWLGFEEKMSENILTGDIVAVHNGQEIPADMLLIHSPTNTAFVDSSNIDGEVILHQKFVFQEGVDRENMQYLQGIISCEAPNSNLDSWGGIVVLNKMRTTPVSMKNFLPRGSIVHDTPYVVGVVLYVGRETKINQNMRKLNFKESWLIRSMNK